MTIQVSIKKEKKVKEKEIEREKEGKKKYIFCRNLFACASSVAYHKECFCKRRKIKLGHMTRLVVQ